MYLDAQYNRRIRIVGATDAVHGNMLHVSDVESGKPITNIARVELILDAGEPNIARVFYHDYDADGTMRTDEHDEPIMATLIVTDVQVAVTAFERDNAAISPCMESR